MGEIIYPNPPLPNVTSLPGYEEGTFTPTFTFATAGDLSVVYTTQTGAYIKTGGLIWISINLAFTPTHTTGSGNIFILGVPYATANRTGLLAYSTGANLDWLTRTQLVCDITGSTIFINASGDNISATSLAATSTPTTLAQTIKISGTYEIA